MKILVTGSAGFIGFHLTKRLLEEGAEVVGIDNLNPYYDVSLKLARLAQTGIPSEEVQYGKEVVSRTHPNYRFIKLDLADREGVQKLLEREKFEVVCNMAAQAGVLYSFKDPYSYLNSNLLGQLNLLEGIKDRGVSHLVQASTSSIYGLNPKYPFHPADPADHQISLYAATKKGGEAMCHAYSYIYNIPTTILRFFTVYGPWGRPDMALFKFVKAILEGREIEVYNYGKMARDFTYIDDIVEGVVRVIKKPPTPNPDWHGELGSSKAPYKIYNIGYGQPVPLMKFIEIIEKELGVEAKKRFLPMQPGDVEQTWADTTPLQRDFGYKPKISVEEGVPRFIEWYLDYFGIDREKIGKNGG